MQYLSAAEAAKKWKISERSVRNYCAKGRVEGGASRRCGFERQNVADSRRCRKAAAQQH